MNDNAVVVAHPETGEIVIKRTIDTFEPAEQLQLEQAVKAAEDALNELDSEIKGHEDEIERLEDDKVAKERDLEQSKRLLGGYLTLVDDGSDDSDAEGSEGDDTSGNGVGGEVSYTDAQPVL